MGLIGHGLQEARKGALGLAYLDSWNKVVSLLCVISFSTPEELNQRMQDPRRRHRLYNLTRMMIAKTL